MMTEVKECATCRSWCYNHDFHVQEECDNVNSSNYKHETLYSDTCPEWKSSKKHIMITCEICGDECPESRCPGCGRITCEWCSDLILCVDCTAKADKESTTLNPNTNNLLIEIQDEQHDILVPIYGSTNHGPIYGNHVICAVPIYGPVNTNKLYQKRISIKELRKILQH